MLCYNLQVIFHTNYWTFPSKQFTWSGHLIIQIDNRMLYIVHFLASRTQRIIIFGSFDQFTQNRHYIPFWVSVGFCKFYATKYQCVHHNINAFECNKSNKKKIFCTWIWFFWKNNKMRNQKLEPKHHQHHNVFDMVKMLNTFLTEGVSLHRLNFQVNNLSIENTRRSDKIGMINLRPF